jgi:hypothetical protein
VAEVRNSRTDSNSLSTLAKLPVLPRRTFILMSSTCSNRASAIEASACALAMSRKYARSERMMKSHTKMILTPSSKAVSVSMALLGITRS